MSVMFNSLPFLWQGLLVTLHVSTLVVVIALGCGVLLGLGLSFGPRWTAWPIRIYSDVIRGLPLLVLIFSIYYMLPLTGWNVSTSGQQSALLQHSRLRMSSKSPVAPCSRFHPASTRPGNRSA